MCQIAPTWTLTFDNKSPKTFFMFFADHNQIFMRVDIVWQKTIASLNRIILPARPPKSVFRHRNARVQCTLMTFPAIEFFPWNIFRLRCLNKIIFVAIIPKEIFQYSRGMLRRWTKQRNALREFRMKLVFRKCSRFSHIAFKCARL